MASVRFNQFTRGILLAASLLVLGLVLDLGKAAAWQFEAQSEAHAPGLNSLSATASESHTAPHAPLTLRHAHQLHYWFFALTRGKVLRLSRPAATAPDLSAKTG